MIGFAYEGSVVFVLQYRNMDFVISIREQPILPKTPSFLIRDFLKKSYI